MRGREKMRTVIPEDAIVLQNIKHPGHLTEEEDARAVFFDSPQEVIEDFHLATVLDDVSVGGEGWAGFRTIKEVWVVATLAQLHHNVEELGLSLALTNKSCMAMR